MRFYFCYLRGVNGDLYLVNIQLGRRFIAMRAKWKDDGTWFRIHETLRAQERLRQGKKKHPTAGAADSQSVKTTSVPSSRGFDGGKKINGRKRHISVDTLGLMIAVVVTTACVPGRRRLEEIAPHFRGASQEIAKDLGGRRLSRKSHRVGQTEIPLSFGSRSTVR